jgi:hypothetical protein
MLYSLYKLGITRSGFHGVWMFWPQNLLAYDQSLLIQFECSRCLLLCLIKIGQVMKTLCKVGMVWPEMMQTNL